MRMPDDVGNSKESFYLIILWVISVFAVSTPWVISNGKKLIGWDILFHLNCLNFGFAYLIGLVMGLVVLITKAKPFVLSLIAGILMMIGVLELRGMVLIMILLPSFCIVCHGAGICFAFIWSVVYTVVAPILGKRMAEK